MRIYTYHESVPEIPNGGELLPLWEERWKACGWEPIILNRGHAEAHPLYNELLPKFQALPSVNPPGYELACYLRWLAVAATGDEYCWMSDADVIPYNFLSSLEISTAGLIIWSGGNPCPCLVSGTPQDFEKSAIIFSKYDGMTNLENDRPHCSDQNIIQYYIDRFYTQIPLCTQYGDDVWETAQVVHYPYGTMEGKHPRNEWIPKLR